MTAQELGFPPPTSRSWPWRRSYYRVLLQTFCQVPSPVCFFCFQSRALYFRQCLPKSLSGVLEGRGKWPECGCFHVAAGDALAGHVAAGLGSGVRSVRSLQCHMNLNKSRQSFHNINKNVAYSRGTFLSGLLSVGLCV